MASLRITALRHLASHPLRAVRPHRRWAQVHDVRFLATQHPSQVIIDKYRAKLHAKAQNEGHESIDDLKSAYSEQIAAERKRDAAAYPIPQAPNTPVTQPNKGPLPSATSPSSEKATIQTLDEIVDVAKMRELPEKELTAIWRLRHANSPQKLCAVLPASSYRAMEAMASKAPQFVLPVPHESQGAEIHFLQWTFDAATKTSTVLFTQLAEFKTRGEFAQPHTTITHHLDLADEKGLVLMQGQTMDDRGVAPDHAQWLVMCLQRFYGGLQGESRVEERKKLVEWFADGDERFSVEKLLEEAERIG